MKKLLALVLALVMVMSLSVVGVSADFADAADIDHAEAVEVMNALNIIGGKENNNFDPNGNVKRSEMAKMVAIALVGDIDPAAFAGTATDLTDINGHWAEGYIKYCVSQGIVAGRGNGKFDPDANVTTVEAAKMLLVALGYKSEVRGYVGMDWSTAVMRDAQQRGLLDELTKAGTNIAMDRDDAAQMIYNTLTTTRIIPKETYNSDGTISTTFELADAVTLKNVKTATDETLLGATFDSVKGQAYLTDIDYDADSSKFTYNFTIADTASKVAFGSEIDAADRLAAEGNGVLTGTLKSTEDYSDLFGQKVNVVYKLKDGKYTLLGIYGMGKVVATGVVGQFAQVTGSTDSIKLNSVEYSLDGNLSTTYLVAYDSVPVAAARMDNLLMSSTASSLLPFVVKGIDNDEDGKIDVFVYDPFVVAKVTYAGSNSIVASGITYTKSSSTGLWTASAGVTGSRTTTGTAYVALAAAGSAISTPNTWFTTSDKFDFPTVAKGDFVKLERGVDGATQKVTVIEPTSAKVAGEKSPAAGILDDTTAKSTSDTTHQVQLDGAWVGDFVQVYGTAADTMLRNTYDFIIVNGFFFDADKTDESSKDVLLVEKGIGSNTQIDGARAKVLFANGTIETITVSKVDGKKYTSGTITPANDTLYTYKKASDGTYELTAVGAANLAGNNAYAGGVDITETAATSNKSFKLDGYEVADGATFFTKDGSGNYAVTTGDKIKTYNTLNTSKYQILVKGGAVQTGYLAVTGSTDTDALWAIVTSSPYTTTYDDETYYFATVWTEDGSKDIYVDTSTVPARDKLYSFDLNANGSYKINHSGTEVAITGYNSSDKSISAVNTSAAGVANAYKITSSTVVLNANTKDHAGVEGAEIATANRDNWNAPITNAEMYVDQTNGSIKAIVVDTANNWKNATNAIQVKRIGGATYADTRATSNAYAMSLDTYSISVDTQAGTSHTYTVGVDTYIVAGDTIKYTVNWKSVASTATGTLGRDVYVYGSSLDTDATWVGFDQFDTPTGYIVIPSTTLVYATGSATIAATVNIAANDISAPKITISFLPDADKQA